LKELATDFFSPATWAILISIFHKEQETTPFDEFVKNVVLNILIFDFG
jgi:hypothetical protein